MKKLISFLLVLSLFVSCAFTGTAEPAEEIPAAEEAPHTIEIKTYPFYYNSTTPFFAQPKIALVDGVADIPYMDIRDCMKFVNGLVMLSNAGLYGSLKMSAEVDEEKQTVLITRENGESMFCDFGEGVIVWSDFYAFFMNIHGYYMDQVLLAPSEGLLRRTRARERYGELTILNLREYDIPMIAQDGLYLLPLQTLSAFFVNPFTHQNLFFNQEAVFLTQGGALRNPLETLYSRLKKAGLVTPELREKAEKETSGDAEYVAWVTQELLQTEEGKKIQEEVRQEYDDSLYKLYAGSSPKGPRSEELCRFGFNELLLELDMLYGLKEAHDIDRFVLFLAQTGLSADLLDPDPAVADRAMYILTDYWLDDLHSGVNSRSYLIDPEAPQIIIEDGIASSSMTDLIDRIGGIREKYPAALEPYYECGDTAYITFDEFIHSHANYYNQDEDLPDLHGDNISLIHYAHQQICRENSPIRNVVLDLSCNTGGAVVDALFTLGWFLGDVQLSTYNTFTRGAVTAGYRADVNLDGEFDDRDTLSGLNLYCLISPVSFSCGNLVPWAFKADGRVRLLGQMSGGGSCLVGNGASAWGTAFQFSSPFRLSFVKNGSYYDLDKGVEPHYTINTYDHYYDREALTEYIHNLY